MTDFEMISRLLDIIQDCSKSYATLAETLRVQSIKLADEMTQLKKDAGIESVYSNSTEQTKK